MAFNSQQYGYWQDSSSRRVNEVSTSNLEKQIFTLTSLVRQMLILQRLREQEAQTRGIRNSPHHPTSWNPPHQHHSHPPYQHHYYEDANSVSPWMGSDQRYYSNSYNQEWSAYSDYGYGELPQDFQYYQPEQPIVSEQPASELGMSLDDIVKAIATNNFQMQQERLQHQTRQPATDTQQFQSETRASLEKVGNQIGQLASSMRRLEAVYNFEEDESAIPLRSEEELQELDEITNEHLLEEEIQKDIAHNHEIPKVSELNIDQPDVLVTKASFLAGLAKSTDEHEEIELVEIIYNKEEKVTIEALCIIEEPKVNWQFLDDYLKCSLLETPTKNKEPLNGFLHERKGIG